MRAAAFGEGDGGSKDSGLDRAPKARVFVPAEAVLWERILQRKLGLCYLSHTVHLGEYWHWGGRRARRLTVRQMR